MGKLVKQGDFLHISHEVPWYLVPKSLSSLDSHCSIFHILFSSNTELLCNSYPAPCTHAVVTSRPLFSPLSMLSAFPSFQSWPLLHTPTAVPPPTRYTPGLHRHSQIVLFLSVYVSVLPTRPWVLWVLRLCLTYLWIPTHSILGTGQAESDCWWLHLRRRYVFFPPFYSTLSVSGPPSAHWVYIRLFCYLGVSPSNTIYVSRGRLQREESRRPCPVSLFKKACYMSVHAGLVCKYTTAFWTLSRNYLDFLLRYICSW